ncbi:MAG: hypothetical protein RLZ98_3081 [Pseudomonadota bacterium]|jgi:gamma-glutamyltranspeptidase/glutathione hydrolase
MDRNPIAILVSLRVLAMCLLVLAQFGTEYAVGQNLTPESASERQAKQLARAKSFMVSAAHPLATQAGVDILKAGGNAIDAAIAVQLVLGLVEPQSSGLGGGAFAVYFDKTRDEVLTYDGRETAPTAARPERFMRGGRPMPFDEAVFSGLSIGVPGTPRLLEELHKKHGKLPWPRLFEPALVIATDGFMITFRLHTMLRLWGADAFSPRARSYFFTEGGSPHPIGHLLKNPEYAGTLRALQQRGAEAIYSGPIAEEIVKSVRSAPNHAGDMTLEDLGRYKVIERPPVCFPYRGRRLCGMGPPSSGGLTVAMTLKLIEPLEIGSGRAQAMRGKAMHLIAEAEKLAYADRNQYMADPDYVAVPQGLLDPAYLAQRRRLINPKLAMPRPRPGIPPGLATKAFGADATVEAAGTTHFSIVDGFGNALAMTSTIEAGFGSRVWAAGFLLNNELTDFSFRPVDKSGRPIANRVEAGKRPRSSMSPTLVFGAGGEFEAAVGSVGGPSIIYYVVKALVALIDWNMDAQEAANLINFGSRGRDFEIEFASDTVWQALKVKPYGHKVRFRWPISGTHIVTRRRGWLEGGADPRREGVARGG